MSNNNTQCEAINNNKKRCNFKSADEEIYCSRHLEKLNKPKKEVKMCEAKNQKKESCPWKAVGGEIYCKRHLKLLGNNKETKYCSGCKNYLPMSEWDSENIKTCKKCSNRGKNNRLKNKIEREKKENRCLGYVNTKNNEMKKCNNFSNNKLEYSEYCGEHQNLAKKINFEKNGLIVCKNWIRGCFNTFESEIIKGHIISKCEDCRKKSRIKDIEKYELKKNNAIKFNKNNEKLFMCYYCNDTVDIKSVNCNKCFKCYDLQNKCEENRYSEDPLKKRCNNIKKSIYKNKKEFNLTDEEVIEMIIQKCHYCNEDEGPLGIGIDRIDSNKNYTKNNCVPSCEMCNRMKSDYTLTNFINMIKHLARINNFVNKKINNKYKELFVNCKNPKFNLVGKDSREDKPKKVEITKEKWEEIIKKPCYYCKNDFEGKGSLGIDRIDSRFGYNENNIVPACSTCNKMKNIMSVEKFFEKIKKIHTKHVSFIDCKITTRENIISEIKKNNNVKISKHIKFLKKNHKEYENLIFNPKTIEEVKNIKIKIEFCDVIDEEDNTDRLKNKEKQTILKDIWKYFRYTISSLEKEKHFEFIGRRFYIMVKDETSGKYLGIMSFSRDMSRCEDRDNFIGWNKSNSKEKDKKFLHVLNLSTCIPLQPFGFNFNGGKLIAMLAFSKEIMSYYKKRYIHTEISDLLGITTTSLNGKSIMYDRLKCFKKIGDTKGNSTKDISEETTKLCKKYLDEKKISYNSKTKLFYIKNTLNKLAISNEYIQSNPKGIYFGFTSEKSKNYLSGKTNEIPDVISESKKSQDIFQEWFDRWAVNRFKELNLKKKFKKDHENFIKSEEEIENIINEELNNIKNDIEEDIEEDIENIQSKKKKKNKISKK